MYYALPNPTVIDCGESLGMDPWMLHMLPARSRPYNSGSAYIFCPSCLLKMLWGRFLLFNDES